MTLRVTTENSSVYTFTQTNTQTLFTIGNVTGKVVKINTPITIGKHIEMSIIPDIPDSTPGTIITTPVVNLYVDF